LNRILAIALVSRSSSEVALICSALTWSFSMPRSLNPAVSALPAATGL